MQPRIVQAGPLVAPTATKVGLSQTPVAAGALVLNGTTGTAVANNICLSQSGNSGVALLLNGSLSQTRFSNPTSGVPGATIAMLTAVSPIYITCAGDEHTNTFAIVGMDSKNGTISETITGTNSSVSASVNSYNAILSITPSANTASTVTVGSMGFATLDTGRRLLFTSGGTDTSVTITVTGSDWAGLPISETLLGGSSGVAVATVLDYLTITSVKVSAATASTISIGTNGVCGSPWVLLDPWALGAISMQVVASGTVNYTVQISNDDPNSYGNATVRSSVTWDSNYANMQALTVSASNGMSVTPTWMRLLVNSQTNPGYAKLSVVQAGAVPY